VSTLGARRLRWTSIFSVPSEVLISLTCSPRPPAIGHGRRDRRRRARRAEHRPARPEPRRRALSFMWTTRESWSCSRRVVARTCGQDRLRSKAGNVHDRRLGPQHNATVARIKRRGKFVPWREGGAARMHIRTSATILPLVIPTIPIFHSGCGLARGLSRCSTFDLVTAGSGRGAYHAARLCFAGFVGRFCPLAP
jgi:hypothetical protein